MWLGRQPKGCVQTILGVSVDANAAISASRSEGLPFNIMEAMYTGLPVVASAVKGHEDLIRDGETGLLYPYGDADACARAVLRLLDSPELREKLVRQARENVLQYGLERVLPLVTEQYESLVVPVGVRQDILYKIR